MKIHKTISVFSDIAVILLFGYLIIFPNEATQPTRNALDFCAKTLIPSLFIYMVLAKIVITLPITDKLIQKFGLETFLLIMGTLCGAPIGAKSALTLFENRRISKERAEFLCAFTNNASMSFVVGFVGNELFGDIKIGIKLFIFQLSASAVCAVIMKFVIFGKAKLKAPNVITATKIGLRDAVADSAMTMLNLCACVVFFIIVGTSISDILNLGNVSNAVLKSMLEFSSGCAAATKTGSFAFPIIAFALGHTGLSVVLQVRSVVANKLSIHPFLLGKLICCSLMTFFAVIFG